MDKPEDTVGTPEYNDRKWSPITKGLTRRQAVYTAHVMEQEVRHITSSRENGTLGSSQPILKYIFPALRLAVPEILDGDLDFQHVHDEIGLAFAAVIEADVSQSSQYPDISSLAEIIKSVLGLVERTKTSIEGLRDIL